MYECGVGKNSNSSDLDETWYTNVLYPPKKESKVRF